MRRTAEAIAAKQDQRQVNRRKRPTSDASKENSRKKRLANLKPWKKGQSGNPEGYSKAARENHNIAQMIAVESFNRDPESVIRGFHKALKRGNGYAFKVLAEYGWPGSTGFLDHEGKPLSVQHTIRFVESGNRLAAMSKEQMDAEMHRLVVQGFHCADCGSRNLQENSAPSLIEGKVAG